MNLTDLMTIGVFFLFVIMVELGVLIYNVQSIFERRIGERGHPGTVGGTFDIRPRFGVVLERIEQAVVRS